MADDNALAPPPGFTLVDEGQGQPASATTQPQGNDPTPPPGFTLVPEPQQQKVTQPHDDGPGIVGRTYEGSGFKGIGELVGAVGKRPIDLYHQAIEAAKNGDWKTASATAFKLTMLLEGNVGADKDHPLVQAAREIIMHPVHEIEAQNKENREAGGTASNPLPGIMTHTAETIAKTKADWDKGERLGAVGDVIGGALNNHIMGSTPLLGPMIQQIGGNLDTDTHRHAYGAMVGDVLGPLLTMGVGRLLGMAGEAMADAKAGTIVPTTEEIAGVKVPVSALTKEQPVNPNAGLSRPFTWTTRKLGTAEGAQEFIDTHTQPAAVKATTQNFATTAINEVDQYRALRNEPPLSANPPAIRDMDGVAQTLYNEARKTYGELDAAVKPEIDTYKAAKDAWDQANPKPGSQPISPSTKVAPTPAEKAVWQAQKDAWDAANPRPKTFTELQDEIRDAKFDVKGRSGDKGAQRHTVEDLENERDAFLAKYGNVVPPYELDAANRLYYRHSQMRWIANKLRTATTGTTGTASNLVQKPTQIAPGTLEKLPASFNNKFGTVTNPKPFEAMMGREGMENFNDVSNALRNPVTKGVSLTDFLKGHLGSRLLKIPTGWIVDNLLFNPTFGQTALRLWRNAGTAAKNTGTAVKAAPVIGPAVSSKKSAKDVYAATAGSLGGQ